MSQLKFDVELVEPPQTLTHQNSNPSDLNPLHPQVSVEFVHKVSHAYYSGHDLITHQPDYDYVETKKVAETGFDLWMLDASFPYYLIRSKLSSIGVDDPSVYSSVADHVVLECKNALHFHCWNNYNGGCKVLHVRVSIEEDKTNHEEEDSVDNDDNDDDDDEDDDFHVNDFNDYYGFVDDEEEEERVGVQTGEAWTEESFSNEEQEEDRVDDDDEEDDYYNYYDDDDYGFVVDEVEVRVMVPTSEASIYEMLKRVRVGDDEDEDVCTICLEEFSTTTTSGGSMSDNNAMEMPCRHVFHDDCIVKWLNISHYCPVCRFEMPTS